MKLILIACLKAYRMRASERFDRGRRSVAHYLKYDLCKVYQIVRPGGIWFSGLILIRSIDELYYSSRSNGLL